MDLWPYFIDFDKILQINSWYVQLCSWFNLTIGLAIKNYPKMTPHMLILVKIFQSTKPNHTIFNQISCNITLALKIEFLATFTLENFWIYRLISLIFYEISDKKTVFPWNHSQKSKCSNFLEQFLNLDNFSDIFCFLTKKIWGDTFWDIGPKRFNSLQSIFFFLLT